MCVVEKVLAIGFDHGSLESTTLVQSPGARGKKSIDVDQSIDVLYMPVILSASEIFRLLITHSIINHGITFCNVTKPEHTHTN